MGKGEGQGEGQGEGKGHTSENDRWILGGCCAICVTICFLVLGVPMMVAGSILISMFHGNWTM